MERVTYEEFFIEYNPKPIPPSCGVDYDFWHKDYYGEGDIRSGTGKSIEDCKNQIDEYWENHYSALNELNYSKTW